MSQQGKTQVSRTAITMLIALLLGLAVILPLVLMGGQEAKALSGSQWAAVRGYLDDFITTQYTSGNEGGFIIESDTGAGNCAAGTLRGRLDSNCDGTMLGVGDDAAQAPILVDVLTGGGGGIIPGTSLITTWNASTTFNPASQENTLAIANLVTQHENANFTTDIISYCYTGHTESVAAGALGAISYAGGYGGTTTPKVYDLKWGRFGWGPTGSHPYPDTNALGAPATSPTYADGSNVYDCGSAVTDAEATRCIAEWALDSAGGNVGNGTAPPWTTNQVIDMRQTVTTDSPATTAATYNVPLDTVFNTGLNNIDPSGTLGKVLIANDTQHTAGMVAVGMEMLGYDSTFSQWGLANYNNTIGEMFGTTMGYSLTSAGTQPGAAPWLTDSTAPVISSAMATPTADGGNITWTTDKPATSVLEWSTSQGGPYTKVNDTILNTSHTSTITGQSAGTTIYYRVSSYDGQANGGTPTSESSFTVFDYTNDRFLYLPWYDSVTAAGMRTWINISNLNNSAVTAEVWVGGAKKMDLNLAANGQENFREENLIAGPAFVRIPNGIATSTDLVVSERTLFQNSFNENLAYDRADATSEYGFPWYDNNAASGMLGDWFAIVNTDPSAVVDVDIYINDMVTPALTRENIAAGAVDAFQLPTVVVNGPVKVVAYLDETPATPQNVICSQRVIFQGSFNEVFGKPLV